MKTNGHISPCVTVVIPSLCKRQLPTPVLHQFQINLNMSPNSHLSNPLSAPARSPGPWPRPVPGHALSGSLQSAQLLSGAAEPRYATPSRDPDHVRQSDPGVVNSPVWEILFSEHTGSGAPGLGPPFLLAGVNPRKGPSHWVISRLGGRRGLWSC